VQQVECSRLVECTVALFSTCLTRLVVVPNLSYPGQAFAYGHLQSTTI
jgi:hypothetical protein